ncbi:hypothetical protein [uncultured Algibacter sp.]|uniref:hypothetical protein n=1 Tax=uncultured Algibacter sp. TaxID=298659 RepID=UPI00263294E0|nr:hypothetical protein [uncultured Algibacter sp.]
MKKLFFKSFIYFVLILVLLELIIRVFHLTKDYPVRIIDDFGVEKWKPNQSGFSVTGNRRQNFSEFRINSSGFNSYREFTPSDDKKEIALVGDSFIEGFHQDYNSSIGKKIENTLKGIEVYEYGYAGYDLADQFNLMHQYKKDFDYIDFVFIGIEFHTDLKRGKHKIIQDRMKLESPLYRNLRKIKLLTYMNSIGAVDALKKRFTQLISFRIKEKKNEKVNTKSSLKEMNLDYLSNFNELVKTYNFDKERFIFLLEEAQTPDAFINYLEKNNYKFIDLSQDLTKAKVPTTLIYDKHWNNHGRALVAKSIIEYLK